MREKRRAILLGLVCLFLYLFLIYDPNFHGADEPVYYSYTKSVVDDGDLNIIDQVSPDFDAFLITKTYNLPDSHNHGGVILWVPFYIYGKLYYTFGSKFNLGEIVYTGLDKIAKCVLSFSTVLFGLLMLLTTFSLGKRYFPYKDTLISMVALFLGTPFFYYMLFELGNANIVASLFSVLSVWFCWYLISKPKLVYWFLYGVFFSLCLSVKTELWLQISFILPFFIYLLMKKRIKLTNLLYFFIGLIPITAFRAVNAYLKYGTVHMEEIIYLDSILRYMPTYNFNGLFSSFRGIFYTSPVFYICILGFIFILMNAIKNLNNKEEPITPQSVFLVLLGFYAVLKLILIGRIFSPAAQELSMRVLIAEFPVFILLFTAGLTYSNKILRKSIIMSLPFLIFWNLLVVSEHITGLEWWYVAFKPPLINRVGLMKYIFDFLIVPKGTNIKIVSCIPLFLLLLLVYILLRKNIKIYKIWPQGVLSAFTIYGFCVYLIITVLNGLNNKSNVGKLKQKDFFRYARIISTPALRMDEVEEEQHLRNLFNMMGYYVLKGDVERYRFLKLWREKLFDDKECLYTHFYSLRRPFEHLVEVYKENGRYNKAIECYRKILEFNPQDIDALLGLGDIYAALGEYDRALSSYKSAISIRPTSVNTYKRIAELYQEIGDIDNAIKYFHLYLKHNPSDVRILNTLGMLYVDKGEFDEAVQIFSKAIKSAPNFGEAYLNLGKLYKLLGKYPEALQVYEEALLRSKYEPDFYLDIGSIYFAQGKYKEAIEEYKQALKIAPHRPGIYQAIGDAYRELKEYKEARKYYQQAIERNDRLVDCYRSLGEISKEEGRFEEAIGYYRKAIELRPWDADSYMEIGDIYKDRGEYDKAIEEYKKALEIRDDADIYQAIGDAYKELKEYKEARKYYQQGIERNDRLVDCYRSLGEISKEEGRFEEAIGYYRKAIELRPWDADSYMEIGHIYKGNGQNKEASIYFKKVIEINPDYADAYYHLGDAYKNLGDKEKALQQVKKLRELGSNVLADELEALINENKE